MKSKLIFYILFFSFQFSYSQSIRDEIESNKSYEYTLIQNSRNLLKKYLIKDSVSKIQSITHFLSDSIDKKYISMNPTEYWGIQLVCSDFAALKKTFDTTTHKNLNNQSIYGYYDDDLIQDITLNIKKNQAKILQNINTSNHSIEDKQFFEMTLILFSKLDSTYLVDSILNIQSEKFLSHYPTSKFSKFVINNLNSEYIVSWQYDWYAGIKHAIVSPSMNQIFGNITCLDLGFNASYKKINLNANLSFGGSDLQNDLVSNNTTWEKGKRAVRTEIYSNLGYHIFQKKKITITPQLGVGYIEYNPTKADKESNKGLESIKKGSVGFGGGLMFDLGIGKYKLDRIQFAYKAKQIGHWNIKFQYNFYILPNFDNSLNHIISLSFGRRGISAKKKYN